MLSNINWTVLLTSLIKLGVGAYLISTGNLTEGLGFIAAAVGSTAQSPGPAWLPTKVAPAEPKA